MENKNEVWLLGNGFECNFNKRLKSINKDFFNWFLNDAKKMIEYVYDLLRKEGSANYMYQENQDFSNFDNLFLKNLFRDSGFYVSNDTKAFGEINSINSIDRFYEMYKGLYGRISKEFNDYKELNLEEFLLTLHSEMISIEKNDSIIEQWIDFIKILFSWFLSERIILISDLNLNSNYLMNEKPPKYIFTTNYFIEGYKTLVTEWKKKYKPKIFNWISTAKNFHTEIELINLHGEININIGNLSINNSSSDELYKFIFLDCKSKKINLGDKNNEELINNVKLNHIDKDTILKIFGVSFINDKNLMSECFGNFKTIHYYFYLKEEIKNFKEILKKIYDETGSKERVKFLDKKDLISLENGSLDGLDIIVGNNKIYHIEFIKYDKFELLKVLPKD